MTNPKDLNIKNAINENYPWSGNPIDEGSLTTYKGQVVGFCNTGCRDKFEKAVDLFDDLIPAPLSALSSSSLNLPLKLSQYPFSQGEPGSM